MNTVSPATRTTFNVDLTKIEGDGDFPCPKCNTLISPDDLTEKVYRILSIDSTDDNATRMTLQCNHCKSIIILDSLGS
jgi:hypothetical protein